jgi:hypothetical protein
MGSSLARIALALVVGTPGAVVTMVAAHGFACLLLQCSTGVACPAAFEIISVFKTALCKKKRLFARRRGRVGGQ